MVVAFRQKYFTHIYDATNLVGLFFIICLSPILVYPVTPVYHRSVIQKQLMIGGKLLANGVCPQYCVVESLLSNVWRET